MSEKKESAVFILSDKARLLDWAKRMITANPSILKGDAIPRRLNIKFGDRNMDILIFRDNYEDADSYTLHSLEKSLAYEMHREVRFTVDGELFPYNSRFFDTQKEFDFMYADISDFMGLMPLYLIVLDKSNVSAQFKSIEPLGDDWDKGADIPSPEILVGVFRAPDEQSALEAVEYATGYPQNALKVRHII